jgi:hypothetical protein
MKTIPTVELSIAAPSEVVVLFLQDRPNDLRITSAAKLLQRDSGESTQMLTILDDSTIEETMTHNGWFGRTDVTYRYTVLRIDESRTRVSIRTMYELPWLLRSVFSWPMGHILADVIASYAATTTVSDLVALEHGYKCRSLPFASVP